MFGCYVKALVEKGDSPVMLITWMRGFDQGRPLAEVRRKNSDGLVLVEAAEATQQGPPSPETDVGRKRKESTWDWLARED